MEGNTSEPIQVSVTKTIKDFIAENIKTNPEQRALYIEDKMLEFNNTFADYNLTDLAVLECKKIEQTETPTKDSVLYLALSLRKEDKIFIVKPEISVKELKEKVKTEFKDCFEHFNLVLDSKIMEEGKKLADFSFKEDSNIQIVQTTVRVETVRVETVRVETVRVETVRVEGINVKYRGTRTFIETNLKEKIKQIKKKIQKKLEVPVDKQQLITEDLGDILKDEDDLEKWGIRIGDTIDLISALNKQITIFVRSTKLTTTLMQVSLQDKISTLKKQIYDVLNLEQNTVRFDFCGKGLNDDNQTVGDCGIKDQCQIIVLPRQDGG